MTLIWFLIVISIVVIVHELGHFLFAKLFNTQVDEFAIGFGPALFKKQGKKTLFRINAFPLGGYVKLAGEDEIDKNKLDKNDKSLFFNKKPWQKFLIAFSGPLFSILLGYFLLTLVGLQYGFPEIKLGETFKGYPAYEAGLRKNDIVFKVNNKYVFDPSIITIEISEGDDLIFDIIRDGENKQIKVTPMPDVKQSEIILFDFEIENNYINDIIIEINTNEDLYSTLSRLEKNDPITIKTNKGNEIRGRIYNYHINERAYYLGISYQIFSNIININYYDFEKNDELVSISGSEVSDGNDLINIIYQIGLDEDKLLIQTEQNVISGLKKPIIENEMKINVKRNNEIVEIIMNKEDFISFIQQPGVLQPGYDKWSPQGLSAFSVSFQWGNTLMRSLLRVLRQLVTGRGSTDQIAGPVGIANIVGQASRAGSEALLNLIAIITINLGIFNLLPLPALDGGRIVFSIYEMITRKRINPKVEAIIHTIGFIVLISFALFITFIDISRLTGN